jgi:GNAT superfamily N-acetyltransferase
MWAMVTITAKAYTRQLLTRPWTSVFGWPALAAWAVLAGADLWWSRPAVTAASVSRSAVVVIVLYVAVMLFVTAMVAAAIGLDILVRRLPGRRTPYLLTHPAGKACIVVDGVDTLLWEATALAAAPPRRGLGSELSRTIVRDADAAGATLQLWCTRSLEPLYQREGFRTVRRRLGMRFMRRPPGWPSAATNS